jgi:Carboxypeptidase regulatory-like domain
MRRMFYFGLALVLQVSFVIGASAQTGAIRGTVVDSQGAVIPGASVRRTDEAKGLVVRETTTAADGSFRTPAAVARNLYGTGVLQRHERVG